MQCSSLNQHLYRKNIVDSPNCICGSTEFTTNYLFHCLRYTVQRRMYINSINVPINLTTEILLFGSPKLALNQNVELFLTVQHLLSVVSDSPLFHRLVLLSICKFSHLYLFRIILFFFNLKFEIV